MKKVYEDESLIIIDTENSTLLYPLFAYVDGYNSYYPGDERGIYPEAPFEFREKLKEETLKYSFKFGVLERKLTQIIALKKSKLANDGSFDTTSLDFKIKEYEHLIETATRLSVEKIINKNK